MRYQYKNGEKLTRFSIRKYHFGAASVAVASLIFFGGGMSAKAENIPTSENTHVTGKSADSSSSGDKNSKIDDKSTSVQDKSAIVEKTADVVATVKVDKAELKKLIISLDTLFRSTEKDKIASIYDEVGQSISEAKLVLDKDTASAEEVNTQVVKLTEITKKLKETVVKADKTTEKVKEESRQVDEKKSVDNKVNIFGKTDKNSESSVSEKKESENQKSTAPDKGKLETLAKSIDVYLKSANEITRPETKELLKGVEETVLAVKKGLENPQLTTSEVEALLKQGKEAEKKLALAVARENSGKRDSDNGKRISPDSYFRAATYYRAAVGKVYDSHGDERLTEATVGYITKANDGSGYPPGTILYISHNDNGSVAGNNNNNLGPQPVKYLKNKVRAVVTKNSNGYHWKITYNEAREGRQNPIYYFTLPSGHSVTRMTLSENGAVVKQGGVREVFNGAADKYLTAVGSPNSGVNGGSYYENVANVNNGIVGDRGGVYTLDDFVKNDTSVYYNRDGMSNEDIRIMDKLYDKIKSSTQNVFAFRPRDYATGTTPGNKYEVEFDTVGDTEAPLYYIAGMKSYEVIPSGRYMHKSYQQWYGIQERYNITVDTTRLSTTFLKGTGAGDVETKKGLQSSAVTIEDTYTNNKFNPGRGDIGEYHTFKPTGNFGADFIKGNHNRFVRDFTGGEDGINMTADRTRGNHTLYIEAVIRGEKINFRLPYKIVTQSDIYQPVSKTVNDVKNYKENLGEASNYITEYRYNSVPGFRVPDHEDMNIGKPFKDRISDFPTSSARIKEQAVKSVEWAGGSNDLTTGARVIELTINGKKELFTVPSDIDVAPGRMISAENVKKLNDAIHEAYKKIDTNGHEVDAAKVPKITSTTPIWVKKQIKVTYYDNENNARTNNQDDSVDYVDVLFKNIRKETAPTTPTVSTPADGTVSVTPNGTTDKLVVSYRPTNQNSDTTITVKKSGTTWGAVDTLPNGVTVNPSNGVVSITEPTVKDESTVTAKATYLNSDEASVTGVAKNPDNVAPTVTLNGTTLTDNASNKTVHVFRGSSLELPLKYYDNAATGRVNISYKNDDGLPQGVWFNDNANASSNYTIKQNGKTVNSQGSYTVRGNVSNTARLGERPITLKVSDSADGNVDSGNKKEVKFNVRTYDIEPNSTKVTVEKGTTLSAQDAKAAVTKVNGALDLPEGTTYEWVDTNGRNQTFTPNTAGVQNYRVKVTLPSSETGNNAAFRSSKIVNVSVNVRPEAPTVTSTTVTNTTTENIILSTDKTLTGSGIAGAKIKVVVNNKVLKEATVEQNGKWSVTLDKGFNSNYVSDLGQFPDPDIVKVTQSVAGVESSENNVKIVLGESKIHPSEKTGSSVFAGAKKLTVEVPHDAGMFYVKYKYREKTNASEQDSAIMRELGFKRETIDGPWIPINPEYGVVTETPVKGKFTTTVTIDMKENIKESTKDSEKVAAIANIKYRGYSSPSGWKATPVTNEKPTLVANYTGNKQVVEFGSTLDPKTLVRASDKEDDKQLTRGNGTQVEVISVNGNTGVKTVNTNETGTYTVKLKATDSQGKQSDEITVTAEVTKNHQAVAKPVINLIQGESLSDADKRSLIELTKGNGKEALPSDARVEVTLATDSPGDKTAAAKVTFKDGTVRNVDVRYKVHKTFETVTKVYDFAGVGRNDSPASYYLNPGGLPDGMSWVFKKGNGTVGTADNNKLKESLNADGIGSTTYNFGAKYPRGRFTDSPSEAEKLSYTPTFTHEVFDVEANNDSRTQKNRVEVNNGEKLSANQAASAVVKTSNSQALPAGTTYEWVKSATDGTVLTDAEKNVTEFGEITRYVKVTLPKVSEIGPNANQVQPYKIIPVTLKVNETVKPTVQMDGRRLTTNAEDNKFVIFRGATFNPTFTVNDNSGKISTMEVSGLPSGTNFIKNTETANGDVQLSGNVTATANATLGTNNVGSVKVTDARGNTETYKFKYVVVDVEVKNTPETVNKGTKLFVPGKAGESKDSHNYVKAVVSPNTDGSDVYYPGGMNFKWSKNNAEITSETVFNTPGTITYNAVVKFPNNKSDKNDVDIDGDGRNENVTIYAPDKIEKTVTFKVKPTAPTVTPKDNGDVLITPTNETNVDKVSVTFTKQDDSTEVTYTAKKNASGVWEFGSGAPLTVDSTTGVFRLKDRVVKDGSTVTAKALTTDGTGSVQSNPATGIAGNGDAVLPEIEFKNTVIDSLGDRVVYITPTETTNVEVATVTDNSNKLLETVLFSGDNPPATHLGDYGLTYNEVIRNGDTITNAPYTLTVTGTLNKFRSGSTLWNDGDVIVTRYASAMDAAENNIREKSGSRTDSTSNPYRVVFKVRTQAAKYTPTANTLTRTDQQAKHTNAQVLGAVSGTNIARKEIVGNIPNEAGLAVVKVTYNDGSSENVNVPINVTPTDATLIDPKVTPVVRDDQHKPNKDDVAAAVTLPEGTTGKTITKKEVVGDVPTAVGGPTNVVVKVTYGDGSTENVDVPVTITKSDATLIDPKVTPVVRDDQHKPNKDDVAAAVTLPEGTTGKTITKKEVVGDVPTAVGGPTNVVVKVTYGDGSTENVDVPVTITKSDATLIDPKVTPVVRDDQHKPNKDDVAAAVTLPEGTTGKTITKKEVVGDVPTAVGGPTNVVVKVTYGDGSTENVDVPVTITKSDATLIDPKVTPVVRDDQHKPNKDDVAAAVTLPEGTTGKTITKKEVVGDVPTAVGGPTNVVVKVTYGDGSTENVDVPVTITKSDATLIDPKVTPVVRDDQHKPNKDDVAAAVTLPEGTTGKTITKKEVVGDVPTAVGGPTNVVVKVTYGDGSTENVDVPVTITKSDATLIDPKVTPVVRDDQHKPNKDDVAAAVTLPEGTTGKTITKKEVVGDVPTAVGGPTNVVVKVTYGDGSTENVDVPVTITKSDATLIDPKVTPVVRDDQHKPNKDDVAAAVTLPEGTTGKTITKKEVVGDVPTAVGGPTNVVVKVTYGDGSTENVDVPVTITKSDATLIDPKVTPVVRDDQHKPNKDDVAAAVTLPEGTTGKTITKKEVVGDVPTAVGGPTNVVVKVTYGDGSTENVDVPVTITKSDATLIDPKVTPVVRDDQHKPNKDDVAAAVTLPEGTTGKTITKKEVVGDVPTAVGGPTNVVVKVTYGDGSTENVDVPVTITKSDATLIDPKVTPVVRDDQHKPNKDDVAAAVTLPEGTTGKTITKKEVVGDVPTAVGGPTNVVVKVTYGDGSTENVDVPVTITKSDATLIDPKVTPVVRDDQHKPNKDDVAAAVTLPEGTTGKTITKKEVVGDVPTAVGGPTNVVVKVTYGDGSTENVDVPVTITKSDATLIDPKVTPVVRDDQHKPNKDDVAAAVTLPEGTTGKTITKKEVVGDVPTAVGGPTNVVVKVTYGDGSTENVDVPVTITKSDATLIDPKVTPVVRDDQHKPNKDDVAAAVTLPEGTTGKTITKKEVVGDVPTAVGGPTNVVVKVTYGDGSTENVDVPVTITKSDATLIDPKVTPVVRDDQHKPNKDDVAAAVTLPEGTTGKTITKKEVVGDVPTAVGGPTNVVVKVTYGDGSTENVDVPVTITKSDATLIDPKVTPVVRDDQHKPNKDDVAAAVTLPEGTTGKTITKKEVVGDVPTAVGGPTNVVVKVTYGDGSTENVDVPVTITKSDATLIDPKVTPVVRDDQHKPNKDDVAAAVTLPEGTTGKTITKKEVVGDVPTAVGGPTNVVVKVTYGDGSTENVDVPVTITKSDATLIDPKVTPVVRDDQHKPNKDDVAAAVTLPEGTTGKTITKKEVVGDVPTAVGGPTNVVVKVTYGDGSTENVDVPVTITKSDATLIDPKVTPVVRDDQHKPNKDDVAAAVTLPEGTTGKTITKKEVVGDVPTAVGGPTNVVVKVTYGDGSTENVDVPVTITKSDATLIDPKVTPVVRDDQHKPNKDDVAAAVTLPEGTTGKTITKKEVVGDVPTAVGGPTNVVVKVTYGDGSTENVDVPVTITKSDATLIDPKVTPVVRDDQHKPNKDDVAAAVTLPEGTTGKTITKKEVVGDVPTAVGGPTNVVVKVTYGDGSTENVDVPVTITKSDATLIDPKVTPVVRDDQHKPNKDDVAAAVTLPEGTTGKTITKKEVVGDVPTAVGGPTNVVVKVTYGDGSTENVDVPVTITKSDATLIDPKVTPVVRDDQHKPNKDDVAAAVTLPEGTTGKTITKKEVVGDVPTAVGGPTNVVVKVTYGDGSTENVDVPVTITKSDATLIDPKVTPVVRDDQHKPNKDDVAAAVTLPEGTTGKTITKKEVVGDVPTAVGGPTNVVVKVTYGDGSTENVDVPVTITKSDATLIDPKVTPVVRDDQHKPNKDDVAAAVTLPEGTTGKTITKKEVVGDVPTAVGGPTNVVVKVTYGDGSTENVDVPVTITKSDATLIDPKVTPVVRDDQHKPNKDDVAAAVTLPEGTTGKTITKKEVVGDVPTAVGGPTNVVVKVTYGDGSTENVDVPVTITKSDATLIDPKVTPVVRDDQHKPNKDDVAAAVTLPEGTTGKTITKKEVVGDVPTAVGGPTNVVVKVTYGDGSTENVDVPVTITKSDATLIDPKVTPVVRDDQHKPNKDDVAAAVTLPEGTTGKTITKKEVVGDVPTAVGGPTNVVVKVTYGDGSTENVDVPVTITKSDATLIDPKVTPVVRDDQHKPNKDDVAAAVTLPEGTTGKTITKKEVVGDVPTAVGGPTNVVVKVTYGDGSTENVDVPVTITKSDATLIDPKVTPVVRDDQHKPNKDDVAAAVTLPEGTTGKTITKKEVVGDVPTAVGGPTNVVVKVTYGDGSTENVDVPVTITKSDATLIDPKVTPVVRDDQHKPNKDDVAAAVTLPEGTTGKTITKKEVVGDVPTAVGGPTNVVVKVTYGDGSTENVDVPVTITKSDATLIDPKVTPVVRDDQHKPNKDDVAAAVTLPEGTTGKTITKKEVVGDVPTAVGGPTNVVVKVTYGDGSTENVDVPVTITKSDATLIDPKVTPVVRDDQHKPNKDDVAAAVTLPEGTTGKTITKKEVVGDVPTAVGGPTNVVVKVTYGDGSTENVDVPVTITKSDATLIDPKVTPVVRDDQHKPNKDDVAAAVTLPEGTTGKTITKKEVVGDVPTAVGGPTNVVVKVTYGDGSTENVDVPVTITKSDATLIDPKVTPVVRDDQHKPNKDDVAAAVTLPEGTTGKTITKKEVVGDVPTAVGGPTNVVVKVTYGDGSTENVDVPVTITKSDATLIDPKVTPVVRDDQHKPNKDDVAAAVTLPEGTTGKTITKKEVVGDVPTAVGGPTNVVVKVTYGDGSTENVDVPVTITKSDATLIDPKVTPVVRDDQHKPNKDDVAAAVTLPEGTTGKTITKKEVVGDVPTAVGGPTNVVVKVTYGDGSTENVDVPVTITKSDATLIDPKVTPVVRDDQHKPNKDDVAAAVTLPEGTTGKTITKKEVVGDVPTAVGGPTNVVVKVTYGDGSTENVDVPVTITKSDATLIDPKVTPVVRDDQHKPNKDDVAAAVTLPEGTTGKTITKKEVVGDVPTAVGGPTNVVVKVTYGDGSTENVDVPVTITKSDATLIDPKVTPVVRDDQHKPNKDDVAAAVTLPEGTTGKTITKKEVVGDVPTAVGGPTNVVVKVTYGDGSTENVDVPVTITKSDATLIDPKVTPVVRDDQHKPNKDDVAAAVTLPEGTTGKTITKKEVVGDVPTAVGGPTNVVVKVTYGDGSTENVDVPVTITKSDATLIDPKVTPVVRDDQHKPNKDDVAAAVTLPEGTTGKTITKKEVVGDVPTAVGGPTNVVVKVTYGDGSTENVDVPVTITKSDATLIDPKVTPVVRDDQHKPNKDDVAAAVTLPEGTTGKTITKKEVVGDVPTAVGGPTNVVVKVTYGDGSTENVDVPVTITKSDATLIDPKVTPVVRDDQHKPNKDDVAAAVTLPEGTTGKTITKKEVVGDVPTAVGGPTNVVVKVTYGDGSTENVDVPVTITKSDATLIDPKVTPVVRDDQHKPNKDDVAAAVTLPEGTTGKTITKKEVVGDVPTAVGGPTNVVVKVTYGDGSTENVDVPVTITKSDATLIDPKVTPVVRDDQHKPNKDDVAAAVTLPEGTTGKTITKKEVVGDVPTAVGGPTNVVVKVTYGDGSTENVDVPVTITKSDATLIDPKVTPVVRDDQHKPNKDDVAAAVTLPEGTTGKTITKKEVVGDVPTAVGGPTNVVVKVTYGDGSTENVDVPVTITKSDATLIDPKVTPVVRDDQHKPNKDDVAAAVTLPEGTTGKTITKKEVVGDVPTAVGGPTNVVVKVTYGDGSTENVDVPVTITKSDATLIDPKVTPVVRDDQHKPNKDDVAAAVTLPEGTTGKTITKKEVVGDVPTAVGGPTNVVVKVTYGDGSTENVDVPVTITKSDATLIDPKVTPVVRDDQHKPNKDDVAAAVTLPEGTTGKTITKKEVVGDVPTAVGGPTNVVVKVTYGDGSTENVDVPVTITKSDATLIDPKVTPVVRDDQHKPNKDDVAAAVTLPEGTTGKTITKKEVVGDVPTAVGGPTNVVVKVTYGDGSTENVDVPVTITKSDATLIDPKVTPVVRDDQHKPNKDDVAAAVTLPEGTTGKTITKKEVVGDVPTAVGGPTNVVVKVTYGDGSTENVDVPVTITKSDATLIDPKVTPVVRDDQHKPNKDDVAAAVTLPEGTTGKTITKKEVVGDVPTAVGGPTNVVVKVTYGDGSTENVDVPVTITKSDATLIDPKVTPVVRDDQHKPNKDDVAAAVTLPEGTTGKTITKKEVVGDVPTAVGGPTNVVVKVTYGDGSTENVDVPVTITKSDATLIDPKVTPVVRDDQHKPNKDDVAAAVTLPEGTTGKTITKKEVVGDVPTAVGGPTNVVVKVTYGDGSTENVDVPVTITKSDATLIDPKVTPVVRDDQHKPNKDDVAAAVTLPEGTTGKTITKKEVVGDVPTAVGGPTNVVVKVTYGDGSTENVDVPVTITKSDATLIDPKVTPVVRDDQHKPNKDDVAAAVTLPEGTTGKTITKKEVVGDVPTAVGGPTNVVVKVTYGDGSTENVDVPVLVVGLPSKTPVKNASNLTPDEKEKVKAKVLEKNPGKEVTVGDDGTATVKDPTTGISHTIPGTDLVNQDFEPVKPTEKVPVKDKAHLTPEEKKQVADKVKDKNPGKKVTVGDDGTATVTDPTTGISHTIPGTDLVNQDFEPVKPTEKVSVKDKAHLTPEEKKQVEDKVKDKNPGKEVTVGDDGTATVKDPTTGISHTIPGTDLVNQDFEPVKPTEKVPVKDKAHLTPEEKKQVAAKVKDKNPGKEVTIGDDGTATVTDPTTGISHTIPGTDLVNQDFEPVKPTEKVAVKDKAHLTPEEKKQVADKVKDKNPGKEVTVGDDGTATVTDPTTGISHTIPGTDLVNQDFEPVKPTEKVPVKDKAHLTPDEKEKVKAKVLEKNPGKEVTVGDDGAATVKDPTTGISHTIPGTDLVNQDFELVKPTEKVPVKDKEHLTPEEKKQVVDKVKDKNPGKEVTVGDDGTATVTDPTTGISHTIPGTDLVNQDFEPVKPTEKVPVKDKAHLTPEEKKQVADKVKDKNPGKEVTVGDDGTATVKDPTTGISHTIPGTDLVNQDFEPVIPADKIPVKDPVNLTQEEQDKVKESVEKANPGKKVIVDKTGKVTIIDPNTNISHEIPGEKLITLDPPVFELPEYTAPIGTTGVDENGNLIAPPIMAQTKLIITKWTDEDGKELKAPDAKAPKVLGEANEALEAGKIEGYEFVRTETKDNVVTHIFRKVTPTKPTKPADNGEEQGGDNKPQPTPTATSTKRLANTGEAETNTGLAGLGLAVLGSLLAVAKRRKKDEE